MALLDVGMAILANQASGYLNTGKVPQRQGNSHPSLAPYQDFPTRDGSMLLAIGNDGQFSRFCKAAGKPEWSADPRFSGMGARVRNREVLIPLMETVTRTRDTADWIALLEDKAVPCGPINDLAHAFADPQVQARGLIVRQERAPALVAARRHRRDPHRGQPVAPAGQPAGAAPAAAGAGRTYRRGAGRTGPRCAAYRRACATPASSDGWAPRVWRVLARRRGRHTGPVDRYSAHDATPVCH